ncbi:ATP-binding protein [Oceanibium sediminis]|uniref:ATP-binding protein n=1 Tax=Oceanibium sediminis TaxID=2026339 RepID=UPI000DD3F10D|nr:ATP-binding protein [Oceanibium sediminis]
MRRAGIGAVWRTTAVRLAALFTLLFSLLLGAGLTAVYIGTIGVVDRQTDATLDAEVRALSERFASGGLSQLVRAIEDRSGRDALADNVYLLVTGSRRRIAGNLSGWPVVEPGAASPEGWISFPVSKRDGAEVKDRQVRALVFDLPQGYRLLVGRDSEDQLEFRRRFFSVVIWVALGTVALGLVSGLFLGRRVLARVERVAEAGERIAAGNLDRRVPVSGRGDEFDRLADAVNAMLDRIEALMQGTRVATDSISHDVRRPLTRVRAELELALRRDLDGEQAQAAMGRALGELDRAVGILNALLNIARAEAGVAGSAWADVDLAQIAGDAAELYQPIAEERGVTLTLDLATPAQTRGEVQLLAQAVANLIDNALKYAPAGTGAVTIATGPGPSLTVSDNGPGIPPEARDTVTERFVRLDAARGGEGSGLGLSLVRAVLRMHGGTLTLEDAQPGLRATITLPPHP